MRKHMVKDNMNTFIRMFLLISGNNISDDFIVEKIRIKKFIAKEAFNSFNNKFLNYLKKIIEK